jgi:hypothetical protein
VIRLASNTDVRGNVEKKNEYLTLRGSSPTSQPLGEGPFRGREME